MASPTLSPDLRKVGNKLVIAFYLSTTQALLAIDPTLRECNSGVLNCGVKLAMHSNRRAPKMEVWSPRGGATTCNADSFVVLEVPGSKASDFIVELKLLCTLRYSTSPLSYDVPLTRMKQHTSVTFVKNISTELVPLHSCGVWGNEIVLQMILTSRLCL